MGVKESQMKEFFEAIEGNTWEPRSSIDEQIFGYAKAIRECKTEKELEELHTRLFGSESKKWYLWRWKMELWPKANDGTCRFQITLCNKSK